VMASLVIWCAIVVYAYGFLDTTAQALAMGAAIGVVLGGSQALSRSLFSRVIPTGRPSSVSTRSANAGRRGSAHRSSPSCWRRPVRIATPSCR
jgi:hypothetical protein